MIAFARALNALVVCGFVLTVQGCASVSYYLQSVDGQLEVLSKRRPIAAIVGDPTRPATTREKLVLVQHIRQFAVEELALPDNDSYRSYADLGRGYVIYNVFATPELSLQPVQSCFLIVGCLDYRGYFREQSARAYAKGLAAQGYDVFVGGVAAYSTLGWFDDPVLSTMLNWDEARVAKFIFHELAHQRLYVKNDTAFNEAFAEAVAEIGLERWLTQRVTPEKARLLRNAQQREQQLVALILDTKSELETLYTSTAAPAVKREEKRRTFARLRENYAMLKARWGSDSGYDAWVDHDLNNAKISAIVTYHDAIPAFRALLDVVAGEMEHFYKLAAEVGALPPPRRHACLTHLKQHRRASLHGCLSPLRVANALAHERQGLY